MSSSKSQAIIRMKKSSFLKEHKRIIPELRKAGLKKEAEEQAREVKEYTRKN